MSKQTNEWQKVFFSASLLFAQTHSHTHVLTYILKYNDNLDNYIYIRGQYEELQEIKLYFNIILTIFYRLSPGKFPLASPLGGSFSSHQASSRLAMSINCITFKGKVLLLIFISFPFLHFQSMAWWMLSVEEGK